MGPLALALREFDEVGDRFRSFFIEQLADDGAFGRFEDRVHSRLTSHDVLSRRSRSSLVLVVSQKDCRHRPQHFRTAWPLYLSTGFADFVVVAGFLAPEVVLAAGFAAGRPFL